LVAKAAINPDMLNEISFEEHNAKPTIIGTNEKLTSKLVCSPKIKIKYLKYNSKMTIDEYKINFVNIEQYNKI